MKEQKIVAAIVRTVGSERIKHGMTQQELAQKCFMKRATIAKLEAGESIPSLSTACTLLDAFGYEIVVQKKEVI